jgi:DNA polymerase
MFCGANTGRWTSMGVNFANMPRPRKIYEDAHANREQLFQAFRVEDPDLLRTLYGDELGRPLHLISDAIRSFIWAGPGMELVQADYSGIEGAVAAWFAGEDWKVAALFAIMADPSLPDMYRRTAAGILNSTTEIITKKHPMRQAVGKVSELALGFQGGVAAFYSMSRLYSVKLDPLFGPVWETADPGRRDKAVKRYESCVKRGSSKTDVLSREAWIACELIKVGWRATNPAISAAWPALEKAIREAIQNPGVKVDVLKVSYLVAHGFLWCRLPSGRCLAYGSPRLKDQVWARIRLADGEWSDAEVMDREDAEKLERRGTARIDGPTSPKATILGVNGVTKKWERSALYGGLAFENIVQAIARDLLVNGIRKAEAAGYPVIAHVYDEIVAEVPRGQADLAAFEKLICELPDWAAGLPLSAGGFIAKRYKKD